MDDTDAFAPRSIELRTARLVITFPSDEDAAELGRIIPDDVELHPTLPVHPQLDARSARLVAVLQNHWRSLGTWDPEDWRLEFVVRHDGDVVGMSGLDAREFRSRRIVETSSWLTDHARGLGIGKEMRRASLAFAFNQLGALEAHSDAVEDNGASIGVSRSLGYEDAGEGVLDEDGSNRRLLRFRMTREHWLALPQEHVIVRCPREALVYFGADD
jgi:RimJ/RimL family protein N-acetyltransferase